ncbi:MAG: PIG-L family deacetylase [Deltaproteobacteria bacterium]|nr:PIG-L family deacetylase [Deltaproteobacteria bacterium]
MLKLGLAPQGRTGLTVLCLGAHGDDLELGAGGAVLRLLEEWPAARVFWVVFSASGVRRQEAAASAERFLDGAGEKTVELLEYRDGFFPYQGGEIKETFERLKGICVPDLIFTHYRQDLHQDHRLISELTWNTFRNHLILEYEIVKYDGDLGVPNLFIHLPEALARRKVALLLESFGSQQPKQWFDADTFYAMLRIRGLESNAPGKYAEGFYCRKMIF